MSRRALVIPLVLLVGVLAASCGRKPEDGRPQPYSERVGSEGGTIEDPAGTTLEIPAGALDSPTSIVVTTFDQASDFAAELGFPAPTGVLGGVQLGPDGLEFAGPVTLRLPIPAYLGVGEYSLCWWNEREERWEYAAAATVAVSGTAEAEITHFCSYAIFDVPPGVLAEFGSIAGDPDYAGYTIQQLGALYKGYLQEEVNLLSGGLLYQGCCYDGAAFTVHVDYHPAEGAGGVYDGGMGEPTEISYAVTYSDGATYTMELTQYLRCSDETSVTVLASETQIEQGESTDLSIGFACGSTAVAGRAVTLELSGPGRLSATSVLTNETGEATASYTAEEEGTAVITAKVQGCGCDELGDQWSQDEVTITVGEQGFRVIQVSPADGTQDWEILSGVSITLSAPADEASVEAAFSLSPPAAGTFTWRSESSFHLDPDPDLEQDTQYTVTLGTGARSAAGEQLTAAFVSSFHTVVLEEHWHGTLSFSGYKEHSQQDYSMTWDLSCDFSFTNYLRGAYIDEEFGYEAVFGSGQVSQSLDVQVNCDPTYCRLKEDLTPSTCEVIVRGGPYEDDDRSSMLELYVQRPGAYDGGYGNGNNLVDATVVDSGHSYRTYVVRAGLNCSFAEGTWTGTEWIESFGDTPFTITLQKD